MDIERIGTPVERPRWRVFDRNLIIVQIDDARRTIGRNGRYYDETRARIIIESIFALSENHLRTGTVPSAVENKVKTIMDEIGIDNPETMHQGGVESRNDFKGERWGVVLNCIDPVRNPNTTG